MDREAFEELAIVTALTYRGARVFLFQNAKTESVDSDMSVSVGDLVMVKGVVEYDDNSMEEIIQSAKIYKKV